MADLEEFEIVRLDFEGINLIDQGFADEIFRVWQNQNITISLQYTNANSAVENMIAHVKKFARRALDPPFQSGKLK